MGRQARLKRERRRPTLDTEVPRSTLDRDVDLLESIRILQAHMTDALCQEVFAETRIAEREREWSLPALARFWAGVVIRSPRSLTQAFEEARRLDGESKLWPKISGSAQGFFDRSKTLRSAFFAALFHRFVDSVTADALPCFCDEFETLRRHFPDVLVIDGSRLDKIARRLKVLRKQRSTILPGCVSALYDLIRGYPRKILFDADAASAEIGRARKLLGEIRRGSLVVGDRAYASVVLLAELENYGLFGLFRMTKTLTFTRIGPATPRRKFDGGVLEDEFVDLGSGKKVTPQTVRIIRYRKGRFSIRLVTNVLEPEELPAETAIALYRARWSIERMYLDLKAVLGLHEFYAANPNAVAMQAYAAAMVYVAMRVSQGRIAEKHRIAPEAISPAKFFPRMANACAMYAGYLLGVRAVAQEHPDVIKGIPDPTGRPEFTARLGSLIRQRRNSTRRKRRLPANDGTWASLRHVRGGPTIISRS
jgi:hypothetical protein